MNIFYVAVFVSILQGVCCIKFFINGLNVACVMESKGQGESIKCVPIPSGNITKFEYDFKRGLMYNFFSYEQIGSIMLITTPLNFTINTLDLRISPLVLKHKVVDIAVDWIRDVIYILHDSGKKLVTTRIFDKWQWYRQKDEKEVEPFIRPENISKILSENVSLLGVQVDPYEQLLFLHACIGIQANSTSCLDSSKHVILRSDLSGGGLRLTTEKRFSNKMQFYIDVNDRTMYTMDKNELLVYDYNGTLLRNLTLFMSYGEKFVVFNNDVYVYVYNHPSLSYLIYRINIEDTKPKYRLNKYYLTRMFSSKVDFKLFDARSRRRKLNGTYICDRTDCPDDCVVRPEGDTCVCKKSRAKTQDVLTCYDCGQSSLTSMNAELTVVRGQFVARGEFPWYAILYEHRENGWEQICGGTLISSNVVLTAAHCVTSRCENCPPILMKAENLMVVLGKTYREWNHTEQREIRRQVKEIRPHENFMGRSANYAHDIALLILATNVTLSNFVMPACLDYNLNQLPAHQYLKAYVPGLGLTEECGSNVCSTPSERLKYTTTNVISFLDCFTTSQSMDGSTFLMLTPDRFCAGNGSESPVQKGDSGGGLTLVYKGLHYVTGVVSIKFLKLRGSSPSYSFGAFTNVSVHMSWIKENLPKNE